MDVVTGKIIPLIRDTMAEEDFSDWLNNALASNSNAAGWHFVMDRLNTHVCEAAVRRVARTENTSEEEMGTKRKSGILQNLKTRAAYLTGSIPQDCVPLHTEACVLAETD